jgi:DNA-binding GntR family transcriptional regulator
MSGKLPPGTRLVIDRIANDLNISAIPVREALTQLEKEGLVEIKPHAGAIVTDIPKSAIEEIFALLEALETASCRLGIQKLSPEDLSELTQIAENMEEAKTSEKWLTLNRNFHEALPRFSGLKRMEEQMIRVGEDWERLRRLRFSDHKGEDLKQANKQHRDFLKALKEKDFEKAEQVIRLHNREALKQYM